VLKNCLASSPAQYSKRSPKINRALYLAQVFFKKFSKALMVFGADSDK
jgi:hypothetical protein